jgi:hypothetical protein
LAAGGEELTGPTSHERLVFFVIAAERGFAGAFVCPQFLKSRVRFHELFLDLQAELKFAFDEVLPSFQFASRALSLALTSGFSRGFACMEQAYGRRRDLAKGFAHFEKKTSG